MFRRGELATSTRAPADAVDTALTCRGCCWRRAALSVSFLDSGRAISIPHTRSRATRLHYATTVQRLAIVCCWQCRAPYAEPPHNISRSLSNTLRRPHTCTRGSSLDCVGVCGTRARNGSLARTLRARASGILPPPGPAYIYICIHSRSYSYSFYAASRALYAPLSSARMRGETPYWAFGAPACIGVYIQMYIHTIRTCVSI